MKELEIRNLRLKHGDGMKGWPTQAPFDGILVAAAPLTLPEVLVKQLALGGRLIVPVGPEGQQQLLRLTRREVEFIGKYWDPGFCAPAGRRELTPCKLSVKDTRQRESKTP